MHFAFHLLDLKFSLKAISVMWLVLGSVW